MTDVIKVLGQLDPAATTVTVLYTVPNLAQTTVSSLVICNRTGSGITFRVSVHVAGASANDKQFLFLFHFIQFVSSLYLHYHFLSP